MKKLNLFFRLSKVNIEKRLVTGIATAEVVDKSGEICDYETTVPYYKAWSDEFAKATNGGSLGNLRSMHNPVAAGKIIEVNYNDAAKSIEITAKVVDDAEWNKVVENVYTGFSQGGEYIDRWPDEQNPKLMRYTANPSEVSLVDNPCLGVATFEVVKADGSVEIRKLKTAGEPMTKTPELTQGWQAKDGSFHMKKSDAERHNAKVDAEAAAKAAGAGADAIIDELNKKLGKEEKDSEETNMDGEDKPKKKPASDAEGTDDESGEEDAEKATGAVETAKEPKSEGKGKDDEDKDTTTKLTGQNLVKNLYDVGRVASIIQDLDWIQDCLEQEAAWEGDNSPQPAKLKECIEQLGAFLKALVEEEVDEITEDGEDGDIDGMLEMAAKLPQDSARAIKTIVEAGKRSVKKTARLIAALEKAGARHSKADTENLNQMSEYVATVGEHLDKMAKAHQKAVDAHGEITKCAEGMGKCMKALGIDPDVKGGKEVVDEDTHGEPGDDKDPKAEKMVKFVRLEEENAALRSLVEKVTAQLGDVNKRLAVVEKEPVANPKGVIGVGIVQKRNGVDESGEPVDAESPTNIRPARVSPMEYKRQTSR